MSSHFAKGIFRVVGNLRPGFLKVEHVRHLEPLPQSADPSVPVYDMRDDLWIDEVPLDMVPMPNRLPNSLLLVTVKDATIVTAVAAA